MKKHVETIFVATDRWVMSRRLLKEETKKVRFAAAWLKANADEYETDLAGTYQMSVDLVRALICLKYMPFGVPTIRVIPGARDEKHNPVFYELCVWFSDVIKPSIVLTPKEHVQ